MPGDGKAKGDWDLTDEELERRKAEVLADREIRGKVPVERSGIRELKLDRRRNGKNY